MDPAMRIAPSETTVAWWGIRRAWVPVTSTLAASLLKTLPIVATAPVLPDFAALVLLAWRLIRPGMWQAQIALPLGLFNDLVGGQPLGQSMFLWTSAFLAIDLIDARSGWRDHWMEWLFASLALTYFTFGDWFIAQLMGSKVPAILMLPPLAAAVLLFPLAVRIVYSLDRWRLYR
jgi:rod shape-determining protein MreD